VEGRARVRSFLLGGPSDRPPLIPFATEFTARLAQVEPDELFSDPHLLTQAYLESRAVCRFECVVLTVPADALARVTLGIPVATEPRLSVVQEGVRRLRTLLGEGAGLAVALPGPGTLATSLGRLPGEKDLEEVTAKLLEAVAYLEAPLVDVFGILETEPVVKPDAALLAEALAPVWNTARYYSAPSLFACARGGVEVGQIGASAVAVWEGAAPAELLAAGAARVGVPMVPGEALPPLLPGGFYTTRGEIPADADVALIQRSLTQTASTGEGGAAT
jgi:hypothetical protein